MRSGSSLPNRTIATIATLLALCFATVGAAPEASAVQPDTPTSDEVVPQTLLADLDLQRLEELKRIATDAAELDESQRSKLVASYDQAITALQAARGHAASARDFEAETQAAPRLLEQIRAELSQPFPEVEIPTELPLSEIEQRFAQLEAELEAAKAQSRSLDDESRKRQERRQNIPGELARAQQRLQALDDELITVLAGDLSDSTVRARALATLAERRNVERTIEQLEAERRYLEARRETLDARKTRAERRITIAQQRTDAWRPVVARKRELAATEAAQQAQRTLSEAMGGNERVETLAQELVELTESLQQYTKRRTAAELRQAEGEALRSNVRQQFRASYEQVLRAGLTDTMGLILRSRRAALPNVRELRHAIDQRQSRAAEALSALYEIEDREPRDVALALTQFEAEMGADRFARHREELESLLRRVLSARDQLADELDRYTEDLARLDTLELELIALTEEYADFIDERVLWIRSNDTIGRRELATATNGLVAIVDPELWRSIGRAAAQEIRYNSTSLAVPGLALVLWLVYLGLIAPRLARAQEATAKKVEAARLSPTFTPTLRALVLTALESIIWPASLLVLAMFFYWPSEAPAAAVAIADALVFSFVIYYVIEFIRRACRERRLAMQHFRWPSEAAATLRRNLTWVAIPLIPLVFLAQITSVKGDGLANEETARVIFIVIMLIMAVFTQVTFRPRGPVLNEYLAEHMHSWITRLRMVWFPIVVGIPVALAALAAVGYYYSAEQLDDQLQWTFLLALGLIIASAIFYRWLWIARRRVAIDQARKRRAALAQQQQQEREGGAEPVSEINVIEEAEINLPSANAQALALFRSAAALTLIVGLWGIWIDVLPALEILNRFELWPNFGPVAVADPELPPSLRIQLEGVGEVAAEDTTVVATTADNGAAPATSNGEAVVPTPGEIATTPQTVVVTDGDDEANHVMLGEAGLAILLVVLTVIATKNIPGMLEIVLLQRLPLDSGARYAITTIARYIIIIIGVVVAFGAIGIGWSKVQWLVAALTFGLAFGLQEIFANFISGLIILVERPMRVGDTITVGDISGEVAKIRMRATTITQWNRKELVVPNKNFITNDLVNWTLSDPVLRIEIPIGIAYGSDTRLARDLLLQVAKRQEHVLAEPPPRALFMGFGDNSLNFELRVFLPHISYLVDVRDQLLFAIDDEFRKAKIEIAFPQRDIHIRTITSALEVRQATSEPDGDANSEKSEGDATPASRIDDARNG